MTRVVFETATLADALRKANFVAPSKGMAFGKAAGILISIDTADSLLVPIVTVKATNLDVYYTEWVDAMSVEGESTVWRLPSKLISDLIGALPIGAGRQVILEEKPEEKGRIVHLRSGNTKCKFYLINPDDYPNWLPFADTSSLSTISDLGGKLTLVEWAAADSDEKINGVYLDGEMAVATDRYRLATVPLKIGIDEPITIPAAILGPILRQTGDIRVGIDNNMFLIQPNEFTQIKTIISGQEYPRVANIMKREYPQTVKFKRSDLLPIMARALTFVGADRFPMIRLFFGKEELNVYMEDAERGMLGDALDLPGQAMHSRVEIKFTPKNIMEALDHSPQDEISISYNPDKPDGLIYINGGSGYEVWVMPRRGLKEQT